MPELPEAETIARQLDEELAGRTLGKVSLVREDIVHGDPRPLRTLLPGRRVKCVRRRAKRVVIELGSNRQLVFALGMTGQLIVCDKSGPIEKHTHLRIAVKGTGRELRFRDARRFGGVWCLTNGREHVGKTLRELGPEPLELTPARFRKLIDRPRQIKALLMDQQAVAGLGNIYCDEALHAAGIHPLTKANELDRTAGDHLLRAIKRTLRRAIRHKGSTMQDYRTGVGANGSFQKYHRVYQRTGRPCRSCGTTIERIAAAGRSTFFCPKCQQYVSS